MTLAPDFSSVVVNRIVKFTPTGGVAPYTFALIAGRGAVNVDTGNFSAASISGLATVRVTDSLGSTADADVKIETPLTLVCQIIKNFLDLAEGQVYLYDDRFDIPPDDRMYIAVGIGPSKPFGNSREYVTDENGVYGELISTNIQVGLTINVMSRTPEARDRK